ncbi:F-box protein CPR1-like [Mercurialis annua]|uniref:F-box protein CPR1-like n=1 Tax=Mercurialis annua TaxID=3986 RepID=UPI00215E34CE|nr:F-box protein CPR1-like [Mercurialis annua]
MSEISFDNLCDILKLLPAKSLLRFRCLSKAYCSLIDSRDFINLHLSQSNNTNLNGSLILFESNFLYIHIAYMVDLDSPKHHVAKCDHPLFNSCLIFGSCNGLIALYHSQEGMFLWNPSTRKHRKICCQMRSHSNYLLDGFGYDPVSDDYKVVRIRGLVGHGRKRSSGMVYSVKHNSSRRIKEFPYKCNKHRDCGTLVGSCLHWIGSEPDDSDKLIVAFNLEDERCRALPIPGGFQNHRYWELKLAEVGGCLTLTVNISDYVEIWAMKEYGKKESWIRISSIHNRSLRPIGYSKTGDKLLLYGHNGCLWEYDLQEEDQTSQVSQNHFSNFNQPPPNVSDKRFRRIKYLGFDVFCCYSSVNCVKSLVSVHV